MTDEHVPPPVPDDVVEQAVERAATKVAEAATVRPRTRDALWVLLVALLVANILITGSLFFVRVGDRRAILRSTQIIYEGVGCLLADVDDHRYDNQSAHEKDAKAHSYEIPKPAVIPLSEAQAQAFKALCQQFVSHNTVSLQRNGQGSGVQARGGSR